MPCHDPPTTYFLILPQHLYQWEHLFVDHVARVMKKKCFHCSFEKKTNFDTVKKNTSSSTKTFYRKTSFLEIGMFPNKTMLQQIYF